MDQGASGAWDERFHAIFSATNVEELVSIERAVDGQRPWRWLDDELHNPYLDAFEAVYGTRTGLTDEASSDGALDEEGTVGQGGVVADPEVTLGPDGLVDPRGELDLAARSRRFWMELRGRWVRRYAWAIPNRAAVEAIASYAPIVEVGGGNGYWAYLLEQVGADVTCYEADPPCSDEECWHELRRGGTEVLRGGAFDDHALLVCWPPFYETMAADALAAYGGDVLVYVGEGPGGCNATDEFFGRLEEGPWRLAEEIQIPQWPGVHDRLRVYER